LAGFHDRLNFRITFPVIIANIVTQKIIVRKVFHPKISFNGTVKLVYELKVSMDNFQQTQT